MKKVCVLTAVLLLGSASLFAQNDDNNRQQRPDPSKMIEQMVKDLKLTDQQAVDFKKAQDEFMTKMKAERDAAGDDRSAMREKMQTLRKEMHEKVKTILTEDQYKQYLEKTQRGPRGGGRPGNGNDAPPTGGGEQ